MGTLNPVLEKLKKAKEDAEKKEQLSRESKKIKETEEELNNLKKKAEALFAENVTEEKMLAVAEKCRSEYPILLVEENHKPTKNKKTGYQYNIGKLGEFLFDILVKNGFVPEVIRVHDTDLENRRPHNPEWKKPFDDKIVSKPGYYLGIKW